MKTRTVTPPPIARLGAARIVLRAKTVDALMNAAARQVALLKDEGGSDKVLVVYGDNAAKLFCDASDEPPPPRGSPK